MNNKLEKRLADAPPAIRALTPAAPAQSRLLKRKLSLTPAFHQIDMMGVAHNAAYFLWFEAGRMEILLEVLPLDEAFKLGVALPVVQNVCHYRKPVRFGMPLQLHTTHRVQPVYEGKLTFKHYLLHEKLRTEMAWGETVVTLVDQRTNQLVKEWPESVWKKYQALK
ncbi:MAG: acyl-CoA thioesterase [Verrucomicrobiota bacterium]